MLRSAVADIKVQQEPLRHANIQTTTTQAVADQKRAANRKVVEMVCASGVKIAPEQGIPANGSGVGGDRDLSQRRRLDFSDR
jgi:hypothetical protein